MPKYIQHLGRGQLIDSELRWQLAAVSEAMLGEKLQDYDVAKQEEIWARLCELKENASRSIMASRQELQLLSDRMPPSAVDISGITEELTRTQTFLAEIRPSLSSREGIEHLLKMIPSRLSDDDDIRSLLGEGLKAAGEAIGEDVTDEEREQLDRVLKKEIKEGEPVGMPPGQKALKPTQGSVKYVEEQMRRPSVREMEAMPEKKGETPQTGIKEKGVGR